MTETETVRVSIDDYIAIEEEGESIPNEELLQQARDNLTIEGFEMPDLYIDEVPDPDVDIRTVRAPRIPVEVEPGESAIEKVSEAIDIDEWDDPSLSTW